MLAVCQYLNRVEADVLQGTGKFRWILQVVS